jgi:cyanophycinase
MPSVTGTLALVGGNEFTDGCTFDRALLDAAGATEVLVLPTAAAYEHPQRLVDAAVAHFASLDVTVKGLDVLARADALDPHHAAAVRDSRCTYLVGGSAMHARSVLMQSPVWEALVAAFEDGATVVGSSAGAQVLCDPMVDARGGAFTIGLGLIEQVAVITQRNRWSDDALHRTRELSAPDLVVLGVDEATAAIRDPDGTWRSEGVGLVEVHVGGAEASLGDITR